MASGLVTELLKLYEQLAPRVVLLPKGVKCDSRCLRYGGRDTFGIWRPKQCQIAVKSAGRFGNPGGSMA